MTFKYLDENRDCAEGNETGCEKAGSESSQSASMFQANPPQVQQDLSHRRGQGFDQEIKPRKNTFDIFTLPRKEKIVWTELQFSNDSKSLFILAKWFHFLFFFIIKKFTRQLN